MSSVDKVIKTSKVSGLAVCGYNGHEEVRLPAAYTRSSIPADMSHIPTAATAKRWSHLSRIADNMPDALLNIEVGLLIGYNCPRALAPLEVIVAQPDHPYGQRTALGWGVVGMTERNGLDDCFAGACHRLASSEYKRGAEIARGSLCLRPTVKEILLPSQIIKALEMDFSESNAKKKAFSGDDVKFLKIMQEGICRKANGYYEMPLPLRDEPVLPDNRNLALQRLGKLGHRMDRDPDFRKDYVTFMSNVIAEGYAELVPGKDDGTLQKREVWYIPHHGVYHPKKPNKIRVVFDASATYKGVSLNKRLLQGPDLTNNLIGVLCRFRQESVAVM